MRHTRPFRSVSFDFSSPPGTRRSEHDQLCHNAGNNACPITRADWTGRNVRDAADHWQAKWDSFSDDGRNRYPHPRGGDDLGKSGYELENAAADDAGNFPVQKPSADE